MSALRQRLELVEDPTSSMRDALADLMEVWRPYLSRFQDIASPILRGYGGQLLPLAVRCDEEEISVALALQPLEDPDGVDDLLVQYANCLRLETDVGQVPIFRTTSFLELGASSTTVFLAVISARRVGETCSRSQIGFAANDDEASEMRVAWDCSEFERRSTSSNDGVGLFFEL